MDSRQTKRTNLKRYIGFLLMIVSIILTLFIIQGVLYAREKIGYDYQQRISSIGTKFEQSEESYIEYADLVKKREPIEEAKINTLDASYQDVKNELEAMQSNFFISKESNNSLGETIILIESRRNQLKTLRTVNDLLSKEKLFTQKVDNYNKCLEKIEYNINQHEVPEKIKNCQSIAEESILEFSKIENVQYFMCEAKEYPSEYIKKMIDTYNTLSEFYAAIVQKNYPKASELDRLFKTKRESLNTTQAWNVCFTKTLIEQSKKL
jgi:hypothetical protein